MRAQILLSDEFKGALPRLTAEELEAVVEQVLEQVREDLEWSISLEQARAASAAQPPPLPREDRPRPRLVWMRPLSRA